MPKPAKKKRLKKDVKNELRSEIQPSVQFSFHAYERVLERLSIEPNELAELLDWGFAVKIAEEKGTHRIHRLFYSREDFQYFIAIQDEKTRTVVTVLPVDYYETLAYKIPQPFFEDARRLVSCADEPVKPIDPCLEVKSNRPLLTHSVFRISVTVKNSQRSIRTYNLRSWPVAEYAGSIARLLDDSRFFQEMQTRINAKKKMDEHVVGLMIRLGKNNGVWVNIEGGSVCNTSF